ncbi:MAG: hypothetical protein IJU64_06205 [Bacilli bacterium]|nr:hypothetical protein [Bacilli bacterium]
MENKLGDLISHRIQQQGWAAFSCYDFTDLASYKAVSKCLERMEDSHLLQRILPGIYARVEGKETFGLSMLPPIETIAEAVARKHKWSICPSGNTALNMLGLSEQVPSVYVFQSNGPYRTYRIGEIEIRFKHTMNRELQDCSPKTLLLIQGIKALGQQRIDDQVIATLASRLNEREKKDAIAETDFIPTWIRQTLLKTCKE